MSHELERLKMKNSKNALVALLAVLATGAVSAQSMSNQGYYGEVGYTALNIKNDSNGFDITPKLARLIVGKEINKGLAVEGTYAFKSWGFSQPVVVPPRVKPAQEGDAK